MPARTVKILDGGTEVLAFARLKGVIADKWEVGAIPPASSVFDRLLTTLPFAFGRERKVTGANTALGIVDEAAGWHVIDSSTCSRTHAVLRFDEAAQAFMLKNLSSNGVDVDRALLVVRGGREGWAAAKG